MKVLVVGSGGREHTLVLKLKESPLVTEIYSTADNNVGIASDAELVDISESNTEGLADWAVETQIDLTVVGPETPLVNGIVDHFNASGLNIFGPSQNAARLEGSKVFSKRLMSKYGIPTADFEVFSEPEKARDYIKQLNEPPVVKADGLTGGKGVIVCDTEDEALDAVDRLMVKKEYSEAGDRIVIEEKLSGEEASILAFTDGNTVVPLETSQDHKTVFEGDKGPNTGGMGAYSPAPVVTDDLYEQINKEILLPTVKAMESEGCPFKGVLYAGLMITEEGPMVLEYNVRFGDPEAQAVLPRLKTDLFEVSRSIIEERLDEIELSWSDDSAVCVVLSSGGYPGEYITGKEIKGLERLKGKDDIMVLHAGTKEESGKIMTAGGRVMGVTALSADLISAVEKVYQAVDLISFDDMHYRSDIAFKALK